MPMNGDIARHLIVNSDLKQHQLIRVFSRVQVPTYLDIIVFIKDERGSRELAICENHVSRLPVGRAISRC